MADEERVRRYETDQTDTPEFPHELEDDLEVFRDQCKEYLKRSISGLAELYEVEEGWSHSKSNRYAFEAVKSILDDIKTEFILERKRGAIPGWFKKIIVHPNNKDKRRKLEMIGKLLFEYIPTRTVKFGEERDDIVPKLPKGTPLHREIFYDRNQSKRGENVPIRLPLVLWVPDYDHIEKKLGLSKRQVQKYINGMIVRRFKRDRGYAHIGPIVPLGKMGPRGQRVYAVGVWEAYQDKDNATGGNVRRWFWRAKDKRELFIRIWLRMNVGS